MPPRQPVIQTPPAAVGRKSASPEVEPFDGPLKAELSQLEAALGEENALSEGGSRAENVGALPSGQGTGNAGALEDTSARERQLAQLHERLEASARRCYPSAARRFRLQGKAQVSFCLDGAGRLAKLSLIGSTGHALLDSAARDCVVPGALPLQLAAECFSVPVRFGD